jgi:L-alanine-DL-glutamate epimerase-like enolase superfamily enzyme
LFCWKKFCNPQGLTDEGIYGLGDCTLNGRELSVASYLTGHVIPCIIGRDPFQTEEIRQYLYRGAYWRKGPTMSAIDAVDMALWDIKGRALNTPLYNLLGGKSRCFGLQVQPLPESHAHHRGPLRSLLRLPG